MAPLGDDALGEVPLGDLGGGQQAGVTAEPYGLRIGQNPDCLQYLQPGWEIEEELNGRNTFHAVVVSRDGLIPTRGQEVVFTKGTRRLFAGMIYDRDTSSVAKSFNGYIKTEIQCVDYNALADRRIVAEVYENKHLGEIVSDLVAKTIASDHVSVAGVQGGPVLDIAIFPNISLTEAFDRLSELTGYYWDIDYENVLHFFPRQLELSPFAIDTSSTPDIIINNFRHRESLDQYRNVQYIDGGKAITAPRTEPVASDGVTRTYTLEFKVYGVPTLYVNGVGVDPFRVGIRGLDEDKDWYWAKGENTIGRDGSLEPLAAGDIVTVVYRGQYDILLQALDGAGINERRTVEGNSGLYEAILVDTSLDHEDVVQAKGRALLNKYRLGSQLTVTVQREGLRPGQQVMVNLPQIGILSTPYLITQVRCQHKYGDLRTWEAQMTTGELHSTFAEFWRTVYRRNPIALNASTVVRQLVPSQEPVGITVGLTTDFPDYAETEWGTSDWGRDEWSNP